MNYEKKYLKYKNKYLQLLEKKGGEAEQLFEIHIMLLSGKMIINLEDQDIKKVQMSELIQIIRNKMKNPYINEITIGEHHFDIRQLENRYINSLYDFISSKEIKLNSNNIVIINVNPPIISEVIISIINKIATKEEQRFTDEVFEAMEYFTNSELYKSYKFTDDNIEEIYRAIHSRISENTSIYDLDYLIRYLMADLIKPFINSKELKPKTNSALKILDSIQFIDGAKSHTIEKWEDINI